MQVNIVESTTYIELFCNFHDNKKEHLWLQGLLFTKMSFNWGSTPRLFYINASTTYKLQGVLCH